MDMFNTEIPNFHSKVFKMVDLQNELKCRLSNIESVFNNTSIKFKYV